MHTGAKLALWPGSSECHWWQCGHQSPWPHVPSRSSACPLLPTTPSQPLRAFLEGLFKGLYQVVGGHSGTDTKAAAGPFMPVNGGWLLPAENFSRIHPQKLWMGFGLSAEAWFIWSLFVSLALFNLLYWTDPGNPFPGFLGFYHLLALITQCQTVPVIQEQARCRGLSLLWSVTRAGVCGAAGRAVTQQLPTVLLPVQLVTRGEMGIGAPKSRALCSTHQPGATLLWSRGVI